MVVLSMLVPLLALAPASLAQHIKYQIPEVQSVVAAMTDKYKAYVTYAGPAIPVPTSPTVKVNAPAPTGPCAYWMENIRHQGVAAFNGNSSYVVFRNVKDYGAKGRTPKLISITYVAKAINLGDGVTDDTAAIQAAIADGGRYGPVSGITATNTPAVVYFPHGTYLITTSIIDYYQTQLIGNPVCMPTLLASPNLSGFGVIDGNQYAPPDYAEGWGSTNVFFRQIRNFIIDMRQIPASSSATGIHWPTAQATSIQNVVFHMNDGPGTQHTGVFIEDGECSLY